MAQRRQGGRRGMTAWDCVGAGSNLVHHGCDAEVLVGFIHFEAFWVSFFLDEL